MAIDNGGPAFPRPYSELTAQGYLQSRGQGGMNLVDWFAGQIVLGLVASLTAQARGIDHEGVANEAYQLAETMIRVRGFHGHAEEEMKGSRSHG